MYRALFVDVDGTLVSSEHALPSKKVKEALLNLKKNDVYVCIVTTRQFSKIEKICKELNLSGLSVVSAGAQIVDVETGKYIYEYIIDHESTIKICKLLESYEENIDFWIQDDGVDCRYSTSYNPNKPFAIIVRNLTNQFADKIINIIMSTTEVFCTKVPTYQKDLVDLCITNKRATKKHGVDIVIKSLKISKDKAVGIGDGENDIEFIKSCGLKIAMGNAVRSVKEIADYTAPDVTKDGVVVAINKYFLS